MASEPQAPPVAAPPAPDQAGLRPRLKLTPTATDEEFKSVFEAAGGQEQAEPIGDSWTWKELLSSMDDAPIDDGALAGVMQAEVESMGIDAAALVPRARIEEIATAFKTGGMTSGRDQIRQLAPAAIRRLSRRMMADRNFHAQAERYVRRYQGLIAEAASRDGQAFSPKPRGSSPTRAAPSCCSTPRSPKPARPRRPRMTPRARLLLGLAAILGCACGRPPALSGRTGPWGRPRTGCGRPANTA